DAERIIEFAIENDNEAFNICSEVRELLDSCDYPKARKLLDKALSKRPGNAGLLFMKAKLLFDSAEIGNRRLYEMNLGIEQITLHDEQLSEMVRLLEDVCAISPQNDELREFRDTILNAKAYTDILMAFNRASYRFVLWHKGDIER